MSDTDYCYPPGFDVLRNRFGIRDSHHLNRVERLFVTQRITEGVPTGNFDLDHLMAIHRHLFQDVYEWAGELRKVELSKEGHQFQLSRSIQTGMEDVHRRLLGRRFLRGLSASDFSRHAGEIVGDVNYIHPFREGNGRTQLLYLEQLAQQGGHAFNLLAIDRDMWMEASRRAHRRDFELMSDCIAKAIGG